MLSLLTQFRCRKLAIAILLSIIAPSSFLLPGYSQEFSNFFESGRLRSEDRIIFRAPPDDTIPVSERSRSWQYVVFQAGGFSFWMPPGILTEETVTLNTSVGTLSFRTLASNGEDRRYVVAYAEKLTPAQLESPKVLLTAIREKVAPANQFQLKEERKISINEYPGRELTLENEEEVITFRAYLVKDKVYVLGAHEPRAKRLPKQVRAFLNAFQLL